MILKQLKIKWDIKKFPPKIKERIDLWCDCWEIPTELHSPSIITHDVSFDLYDPIRLSADSISIKKKNKKGFRFCNVEQIHNWIAYLIFSQSDFIIFWAWHKRLFILWISRNEIYYVTKKVMAKSIKEFDLISFSRFSLIVSILV
jgi:hypothetical protein